MTEEFNLSERIKSNYNWSKQQIEDVKEFIRLLKEGIWENKNKVVGFNEEGEEEYSWITPEEVDNMIDKLAGEKLNGSN